MAAAGQQQPQTLEEHFRSIMRIRVPLDAIWEAHKSSEDGLQERGWPEEASEATPLHQAIFQAFKTLGDPVYLSQIANLANLQRKNLEMAGQHREAMILSEVLLVILQYMASLHQHALGAAAADWHQLILNAGHDSPQAWLYAEVKDGVRDARLHDTA